MFLKDRMIKYNNWRDAWYTTNVMILCAWAGQMCNITHQDWLYHITVDYSALIGQKVFINSL